MDGKPNPGEKIMITFNRTVGNELYRHMKNREDATPNPILRLFHNRYVLMLSFLITGNSVDILEICGLLKSEETTI